MVVAVLAVLCVISACIILSEFADSKNQSVFTIDGITYSVTSEEDHTVAVTGYTGMTESVTIPSVVVNGDTYHVTSIGSRAFINSQVIIEITLPEGIVSIEGYAFAGCYLLKKASLPDGLISVGYNAFSGCASLKTISIPDSVTSLGDHLFDRSVALETVEVGVKTDITPPSMGRSMTRP